MNIDGIKDIVTEYVPNAKSGSYEFRRFNRDCLRDGVSVTTLRVTKSGRPDWEGVAGQFFKVISSIQEMAESEVHCFIISPSWQKNTRVARHYGLHRLNSVDIGLGTDQFILEGEVVSGDYVIFYGVIKLALENAKTVFQHISKYENGILLSEKKGAGDLSNLIGGLVELSIDKPISRSFHLNVVNAINYIVESNELAFLPYGWEETGDYHLDIFENKKIS